jgi:hypothetical protein
VDYRRRPFERSEEKVEEEVHQAYIEEKLEWRQPW